MNQKFGGENFHAGKSKGDRSAPEFQRKEIQLGIHNTGMYNLLTSRYYDFQWPLDRRDRPSESQVMKAYHIMEEPELF